MKKSARFNNGVSITHLKLKKGEVRTFRILKRKKDPTSPTGFHIPSAANVPTRDVIERAGKVYDIAAIRSIGLNGVERFHKLWFTKESGGVIKVEGGRIADQEKYEYLMLSNYRSNNPDRDPSYKMIYELVDVKASAAVERATRTQRLKAENYAAEMEDEEIITFGAASGWVDNDIDILRNKIENMATDDPINFLKIATNRHNNIKADIKNALDKGVINFDKNTHQFTWKSNGELIVTVPRSTSASYLDGMLNFIVNSEAGESVYDEIKLLMNPENEVKTPPKNPANTGSKNPPKRANTKTTKAK